jgi:hypothetical protein
MCDLLILFFLLGAINSSLLYIWFKTNAFVEYVSLFSLGKFFHVNEYKEATVDDQTLHYTQYLSANYNSFLTKLFVCPKCICVWTSAFLTVPIMFIFTLLYLWPVLFVVPAILLTMFFSLVCYGILVKLKHE